MHFPIGFNYKSCLDTKSITVSFTITLDLLAIVLIKIIFRLIWSILKRTLFEFERDLSTHFKSKLDFHTWVAPSMIRQQFGYFACMQVHVSKIRCPSIAKKVQEWTSQLLQHKRYSFYLFSKDSLFLAKYLFSPKENDIERGQLWLQ